MSKVDQPAQQAYVPSRRSESKFPLIDSDPHFRRVLRYARPSDYATAGGASVVGPSLMLLWEQIHPSHAGKGGLASVMRLGGFVGVTAGFLLLYQNSYLRFLGVRENAREQRMDMREMVEKVKKGEPLYGVSTLTPYMQGVAARNSRNAGFFLHLIPWFNFVNHEQHGVDTAKYYRQAEQELEAGEGAS